MSERELDHLEDNEDALLEGDRTLQVSSARAALRVRDFRVVWIGAFASNIGNWMQNVTLGALAYELSSSATFVSLVTFAQLGPMLLLSIVGGMLADTVDRRRMTFAAQLARAIASVGLALVVLSDDPSRTAIVLVVLAIGIFNALNAPAWTALLPSLVPREHLSGAVSLNSTQMNASRVIGPAIAGVLYPALGAAGVFGISAASVIFSLGGLLMVKTPTQPPRDPSMPTGLRRLASGLAFVRQDDLSRRALIGLFVFSMLCLPFIGQMPTVAEENLGMDTKSAGYGLLYACFGLGAVTGAVSIGTFLSHVVRRTVITWGLIGFAASLATFALLRQAAPAYPVVGVLGFSYFASVTALNTILQEHLPDAMRGRVMSLWLMAFGGTVPLGLMLAGPIAEALSISFVLLYGAVVAMILWAWVRFVIPPAAAVGTS